MRSRKLPQQRKHKKLKSVDPANHTAQRALKFKQGKHADQPPADEDFQPAPRSFTDLMKRTRKLIEKPKRPKLDTAYAAVVDCSVNQTPPRQPKRARDSPSNPDERASAETRLASSGSKSARRSASSGDIDQQKPDGEPVFKRRRNESKWNFLQRMNRAAQTAMTKASIESRFGVTLKNAGKGKVVAEADHDLLLENQDAADMQPKTKKNTTKTENKSVHVTKKKFKDVSTAEANKRTSRAEHRRDYAFTKRENETFAPEAILFGERNDRPPTLTATPRIRPKKPGEPVDFPLFDPSTMLTTPQKTGNDGETEREKFQKMRVEQRRVTVVDQYRQLKKLKWKRQQEEQQHKPLVEDSPGGL